MLGALLVAGCGRPAMPAPGESVDRYVHALEGRDADTLWSMMSSTAQTSISKAELAQLLNENHKELTQRAHGLSSAQRRIEQRAVMFLEQGSQFELTLEGGQFYVQYQQLLVGDATSPHSAVEGLRVALQLRDYPKVLASFSPELRDEVESGVESLQKSLAELDSAVLDVQGDTATYTLAGGGVVRLKKVGQTWLITELP